MRIIYHADDYGIAPRQSQRILAASTACGGEGALNSLSFLVNTPSFSECADMIEPYLDVLDMNLHVNLVEGGCVANPAEIPLLVDENGLFNRSFANLFLAFSRHDETSDELARQVQREIRAQLVRYTTRFPRMKDHLRVDSHQHFHLIPRVYQALWAAVEDLGCHVDFLRVPAEPLAPFIRTPGILAKIPAVNLVKRGVLNRSWRRDRDIFPIPPEQTAVFCGINFSGHMTYERVSAVLPAFEEYAQACNMDLELLFHPGGLAPEEPVPNPLLKDFERFYRSPLREEEARALLLLG